MGDHEFYSYFRPETCWASHFLLALGRRQQQNTSKNLPRKLQYLYIHLVTKSKDWSKGTKARKQRKKPCLMLYKNVKTWKFLHFCEVSINYHVILIGKLSGGVTPKQRKSWMRVHQQFLIKLKSRIKRSVTKLIPWSAFFNILILNLDVAVEEMFIRFVDDHELN